jgi:hypothetical protein
MTRLFALCALLLLAACRDRPRQVETSLYFGFSKADGSEVPDSAWQQFLHKEAARTFPEGFTVIPAAGMWREGERAISERSAVIVSLNRMDRQLSRRIDSLRERYKKAFDQQSVMRVDIAVDRWDY